MHEEVLKYINGVLSGEGAKSIGLNDTLKNSDLDSFGYMLLWVALEERYGKVFGMDDINALDYETMRIETLIQRIVDVQNNPS